MGPPDRDWNRAWNNQVCNEHSVYDCPFTVSRAVSLSLQSTFQLSLAVLVLYWNLSPIFSFGRYLPPLFSLQSKTDLLVGYENTLISTNLEAVGNFTRDVD